MSRLSPGERNRVIDQIHGQLEALREDEYGLDIRGCREALVPLLIVVILALLGYVFLRFSGLTRLLLGGLILVIALLSLGAYFATRPRR
jgi:hypothetical protein